LLGIFRELVVGALEDAAAAELGELEAFRLIARGPELALELAGGERGIFRREGEVVKIRTAGAGFVRSPGGDVELGRGGGVQDSRLTLERRCLSLLVSRGVELAKAKFRRADS
jgi:hypothetical protein